MKKFLSLSLAALTLTASLAACAPAADKLDPAITLTSSAARANAEWLDERLDVIPDDVVVGIGSNADYGIDMSDFESDGYIARAIGDEVLLFGKTEAGLDRAVREYAKAADVNATADLDTVYHEGARIKNLTIADRDISEYTIIYNYDRDVKNPGGASPTFGNTQYAAQELERLILQATGIDLPVKTFDDKVTGPVISIDYYEGDDLGENGFTYKVEGGNLYIEGVGRANGCANAVYYLLEHECGWDALLFGDSDLQEADRVDIPNGVEKKVKPMFDYIYMRHMFYDDYVSDKSRFSHTYRGSVDQAGHAIGRWAGTPGSNICYTDEFVFAVVVDNVWLHVSNAEDAGKIIGEDLVTIDIGMEDATNLCRCRSCMVVHREEKWALSGAQIRFANKLSDAMAEEGYDNLKYNFFSYAGSNVHCVTKPYENVYVTYCTNGSCISHLADGSQCSGDSNKDMGRVIRETDPANDEYEEVNNVDFTRWMYGWGDLADHVYVYGYMLPANFSQYAYMDDIYEDVHLMYDAGMEGFSPEAEYCGLGLNRLRFLLIMDIIWHPEMTKAEYELRIADHMRREYGDGYAFVEEFIDIWDATEENTGCWTSWLHERLISTTTFDMEMYADRAAEMYGLLEYALKQCNTAAQEERIKRLMCDVLYKECYTQYFKAYDAGDTEKIEYLKGRYDIFVGYMSECGYSFETLPASIWAFGPYVYNGVLRKILQNNLEDAAWIDWYNKRDQLPTESAEQKPMPGKYEEYWETAETK